MTLSIQQGGSLQSSGFKLTTTTSTVVYTVPNTARPILDSINLANTSGAAVSVSVNWYKSDLAMSFALISVAPVAAGERLTINNLPISMRPDDEIRVTATAANAVDVIVCLLEVLGASR